MDRRRVRVTRRTIVIDELPPISYRINSVLIPGTTGGLYTIGSGFMLIVITAGVYLFGFIFNKPIPNQFNDLLYSAVGLLTIHAGRAIFGERSTAQIARQSIAGLQSGQEINVNAQDGTVSAEMNQTPYAERPAPPPIPEEPSDRG